VRRWIGPTLVFLVAVFAVPAAVYSIDYQRPVDAAPNAKDIGGGYAVPAVQHPLPRAAWWAVCDVVLLATALAASAWIVLVRRSRTGLAALTVVCLVYFGFYRKGCVCPIGAIQNVAVALTDPAYAVPYVVIAFFFLPLLVTLLFGRVFCGGVCPLGGIQDLVVLKGLEVPRRLDRALGWLKYVYLLLAVWYAIRPVVSRDFIICRFDPFVGLFRRTGSAEMLIAGGALLVLGMFIGRPYCRWLCPYGGLLAILSRFSWRGVTITPKRELDCGLCTQACPFGAIEQMRAVRTKCLSCARCYASCPEERATMRALAPRETAGNGSTL
jgi:NosR/NirI family transcriptional regulator, nitrous oxide reductase regulator